MKLLAWLCLPIMFFSADLAFAAMNVIPQCARISPYQCDAEQACHFWIGQFTGKCINLTNLETDNRYYCQIDSYAVSLQGVDMDYANQQSVDVFSVTRNSFSLGTARISKPKADIIFNIESGFNPGDVTVHCAKE